MSESLRSKAVKGTLWASASQAGHMVISFSVNIVLARLLMPTDYGLIGMITIFIALSNTFIDSGFGSALIQKKDPTDLDYSTIFWWNFGLATFLYCILFFSAPLIADFYNQPLLTPVTRLMGLSLVISSLSITQSNQLRKRLQFNKLAVSGLSSAAISGIIAIACAAAGMGVYSLIVQQIAMSMISLGMLICFTRWIPRLKFSIKVFKSLFSFGGYLLAATLFQTGCQNIVNVLIGKAYTPSRVGLFVQAQKLDSIASYNVSQVLTQVMFPVFSSIQDDKRRLGETLLRCQRIIAFIVFPILTLLIVVSDELIELLYGDKWIGCIPYFKILCVGGLFVCLQNISYYAVAAIGKSKILFKWSFYKWGVLLVLILSAAKISMTAIVWAIVISNANIMILNMALAAKYVGLRLSRQLSEIGKTAACIIPTFIVAELCGHNLGVISAAIVFPVMYLVISRVINDKALIESRDILLTKFMKRHHQ